MIYMPPFLPCSKTGRRIYEKKKKKKKKNNFKLLKFNVSFVWPSYI